MSKIVHHIPTSATGADLEKTLIEEDQGFLDRFSDDVVQKSQRQVKDLLSSRGWDLKTLTKDGTNLETLEAFELDRISASAFNALKKMLEVRNHIMALVAARNYKGIRALRDAFEFGLCACEAQSHKQNAAGRGRKRKDPEEIARIFRKLDDANRRWKNSNPLIRRRARHGELMKFYVGPPDLGGNSRNWVTEWRKNAAK